MVKNELRSWMLTLCMLSISGTVQAQQASLPPEVIAYSDMVFYNGKIITADDQHSVVSAVAIRDGKFLAVGNDDRILRLSGPRTQKIDLQGKSVVPGFIDNHKHGAWVGNVHKRGLSGRTTFKDKQSGLEEVKRLVEATAPGEWVTLSAPRNPAFLSVTRNDLDPISPDIPVVLTTSGTDTTVNSITLDLAEIPPGTPGLVKDPETGEPNGQLWGWAAGIVLYETKPWPPVKELIPEQKERLAEQNALGFTTLLGRGQGLAISVLRELWLRNELTVRVRLTHEFLRMNPYGEAYLKRLGNLSGFGDQWFKIVGTTVGPVDGASSDGAVLSGEPKLRQVENDAFSDFGQNKWLGHGYGQKVPNDWDTVPQEVREKSDYLNIILANRYGWNITSIHSSGDESTRITLKAYEAASKEKPLEGRWGIDHQPMQTPETLALLKTLNIIPSVYYFTGRGDIGRMLHLYGADRVSQMVPLRTMIDEGILPTSEPGNRGPLAYIEAFVTRKDLEGNDERVFGPQEKISRMEALLMHTKWAARRSAEEDSLGTIESGKLADLVILDRDFLEVAEEEISEIKVLMTVVGGTLVFDAATAPTRRAPAGRGQPE